LPENVAKDLLSGKSYLLDQNYSFEAFRDAIFRIYIENLDGNLPFKLDGKYGSLPKCTECPHKGSRYELFAEYAKEDKCPFAKCFREKENIAEEQKAKAKAKAHAAKGKSEEEAEDDDDDDNDSENQGSSDKYWAQQRAIDDAKRKWYLDKLMERGISATDVFAECICGYNFLDDDFSEFYQKYLDKSYDELQQSGTYEEILKAKIISELCDACDSADNDAVTKWLGCEECPDEVLNQARVAAL